MHKTHAIASPHQAAEMNFASISNNPWSPTNKHQQDKWKRIIDNSSNIPMVIIEPDDMDIPLPKRGKKYVKGEKSSGGKGRRAEVARAVKEQLRERAMEGR